MRVVTALLAIALALSGPPEGGHYGDVKGPPEGGHYGDLKGEDLTGPPEGGRYGDVSGPPEGGHYGDLKGEDLTGPPEGGHYGDPEGGDLTGPPERGRYQARNVPARIVSLIPAVTEMLFAIGAGSQVAAVSSFDTYPPEVKKLPRVGALIDPDVEKILSIRPDLVILFATQTTLREQLERAHIPVYVYRDASLADVLATMRDVGARVGQERNATELARRVGVRIDAVRRRVAGRPRPRTLIVFDREKLVLRGIYASGGVGFIHDMVDAAGGDNVFADVKQRAVQATTELILARRPDIVLELRADPLDPATRSREVAAWNTLSSLPAVRSGRVYFIDQQKTVVPGPRVAEAVELIARTLHQEAFR